MGGWALLATGGRRSTVTLTTEVTLRECAGCKLIRPSHQFGPEADWCLQCEPHREQIERWHQAVRESARAARAASPCTHGHHKLTPADVRAIRAAYAAGGVTQRQLGAQYGVAQITISFLLRRQTWRCVP